MRHSTAQQSSLQAVFAAVADIAKGICQAVAQIGSARAKVRKISALWSLTDAELAVRGLRREDIIRLVMADAI